MTEAPTYSKAQEQMAELPDKLHNTGEYRNSAEKFSVWLNIYNLKLDNVVDVVYKQELKFYCFLEPKTLRSGKELEGKWKELWKGPKNDVGDRLRSALNYNLYKKMFDLNATLFGAWDPESKSPIRGFAYDCSTILYSILPVVENGGSKEFIINKEDVDEDHLSYIGKDRIGYFKGVISGCEEIALKKNTYLEERDRSALQFFDVLFNQFAYQKDLYYIFPSKMFKKDSNIQLNDDARILKSGMQKNVRIVGDDPSNVRPILQLDAKTAAFYPSINVVDFVKNMLARPQENFNVSDRIFMGNHLSIIRKQLKGISMEATHSKTKHIFVAHSISDEPASKVVFDVKGSKKSVVDYFFDTYSMRLRYPHLPCIIERKPKRKDGTSNDAYFPMEVLTICEGQRVPFDKQTPKLVEQMIRKCQVRPTQFHENTSNQKSEAFLSNSNPFIKAFKLGVANDLEKAPATLLHAPTVKYNDRTLFEIENKDPAWRQFPTRFIVPANVGKWVFAALQRCLPDQVLNNFADMYVNLAKQHGMNIERPSHFEVLETDTAGELRNFMGLCRKNSVRFMICVTKDRLDPIHNLLKAMEIEFGIITQHISGENVRKSVEQPNRKMTLINIIMKSNLKLGGVNYALHTSKNFARANPKIGHDIVEKEWLRESRMFFGIDFSHASPQSLYERQANIACIEPTVVGMAYTMGPPLKMMGKYWFQEPRVTHVQRLDKHIVDALLQYQTLLGRFPQHIVVYRSGASEGEYRIAITYEQKAFDDAFEILMRDYKMVKKPFLTIIVVQRNSNYRMIPTDIRREDKPFMQNVPSGTCLDKNILHPTQTEFLLVGHKTIQGTARPVRCTVIWDNHVPRVKLEELEYVTYSLCFAHGIVCSPVSVPAPLYSAADLAKRGRNNYKTIMDIKGHDNAKLKYKGEGDTDYFDRLSAEINTAIETKYWA